MFLSLVRSSCFFSIILISFSLNAEILKSEGSYYLSMNISLEECYERAEKDAVKKVMESAGFERIVQYENLNCAETYERSSCEYFQESQVYFEGGFITTKKFSEKQVINLGANNSECKVKLEANVEKFNSQHDSNFILEARLNNNIFRDGEELLIFGETNIPSNLYLFSLDKENEEFNIIVPNDHEKLRNVVGVFQIPSKNFSNAYGLKAKFPDYHKNDIIQEYLVLLATKRDFKVISSESSESMYKRLNNFGRENWKQKRLGYVILKE